MPAPAPSINPLGLFGLTVKNGSTIQAGNQVFNPGDVPAPPVYGLGAGAATDYTQFNFGGQAAPDMQRGLNSPHASILAPPAPPAPAKTITTPGPGTRPFTPGERPPPGAPPGGYGGINSLNPMDSLNRANLNDDEWNPMDAGFFARLMHSHGAALANAASKSYHAIKNTALSPAAMTVPATPLQFATPAPAASAAVMPPLPPSRRRGYSE